MAGPVPPGDARQAVTTTVVPIGAKRHSAIASGRRWRMQPCDCGVPSSATLCTGAPSSIGMSWKPIAAPWSPCGEPDEVHHRAGVVDADRGLRAGVDTERAGVEVVVDAPGDQIGTHHLGGRVDEPHPLPALAEHDPPSLAGLGRQRGVLDVGCGRRAGSLRHSTSLVASTRGVVVRSRSAPVSSRRRRRPVDGRRRVGVVGQRRQQPRSADHGDDRDRERGRERDDPAVAGPHLRAVRVPRPRGLSVSRPRPVLAHPCPVFAHGRPRAARAARFSATSR